MDSQPLRQALHLTVTPAEDGLKLMQFLTRRLDKNLPGSVLMRWIRTGQVRVDGRRAKPFDRLEQGQQVRVPPQAHGQMRRESPAAAGPLEIVYEDNELIVLAKPAGLPTQPGSAHADSLATRLAAHFSGADYVPAPAHRLDRDTSGLVAAGKTHAAQQRLHELFARTGEDAIMKDYLAWVQGRWPYTEPLLMEDQLDQVRRNGRELVAAGDSGRLARATASLLDVRGDRSLLLVRLHTGRRHQIRAQLSTRGFPVIGDRKYGGPKLEGQQGMLLHAWRLDIPGMGTCKLPPDWTEPFALDGFLLKRIEVIES